MNMTIYMGESYDWDGNLKARKFARSLEIIRQTAINYYYGEGMTLARQYLRARVDNGDITWEEHRRIMVGLLHLSGVDLSLATI